MGYVQSMVGNNYFRAQFEYGHRRDIINYFLELILAKYEVGQGGEGIISDLHKKVKVKC